MAFRYSRKVSKCCGRALMGFRIAVILSAFQGMLCTQASAQVQTEPWGTYKLDFKPPVLRFSTYYFLPGQSTSTVIASQLLDTGTAVNNTVGITYSVLGTGNKIESGTFSIEYSGSAVTSFVNSSPLVGYTHLPRFNLDGSLLDTSASTYAYKDERTEWVATGIVSRDRIDVDVVEVGWATLKNRIFAEVGAHKGWYVLCLDLVTRRPAYVGEPPDPAIWAHLPQFERLQYAIYRAEARYTISLTKVPSIRMDLLDTVARYAGRPSSLVASDGSLVTDPARLRLFGRSTVRGAAADGATVLLLRATVNDPAVTEVTFALPDTIGDVGGLGLGDQRWEHKVSTRVDRNAEPAMAFAYYLAPKDFSGTPLADGQSEREVVVKLYAGTTDTIGTDYKIIVGRPPLLLVHGIWSSASKAWGDAPLTRDSRFKDIYFPADYEDDAEKSFAINLRKYSGWVTSTLNKQHERGIAAVRVDAVGHSMGGILSRLYVQRSNYLRGQNHRKGDLNRLITLNTPHKGTPLADYLWDVSSGDLVLRMTFRALRKPIGGAVYDLRAGSEALRYLSGTPVRSRALVGTLASPMDYDGTFTALRLDARGIATLFGSLPHDGVVGGESQHGGMGILAARKFTHAGSFHTFCTEDLQYTKEIIDSLNARKDSNEFGFFLGNDTAVQSSKSHNEPPRQNAIAAPPEVALRLVLAPGIESVEPGSTVELSVLPSAGVRPEWVMLVGPSFAEVLSAPPYNFLLKIPATEIGALSVEAYGSTATGSLISEPLSINVVPKATMSELQLSLGTTFIGSRNQTTRATVHGIYSGVRYRMPLSPAFIFSSTNPEVAQVDSTGTVTAVAAGVARISVRSGVTSATAEIRVDEIDDGISESDLPRILNLSLLTSLAGSGDSFTMGFVVGGNGATGSKPLVLRASGPSLGSLGVAGALDDPKIELYSGTNKAGENDNWGGAPGIAAAMAGVGAFPFAGSDSRDAALVGNIATQDNSVRISAVGSSGGAVLAEVYDATAPSAFGLSTPRLLNVSVLKQLGSGLTAGFVIGGNGVKRILIRAVGPTLAAAPFNISGVVADPQLSLFGPRALRLGENDNWGNTAALTAAFSAVGAFKLQPSSRDAALLATVEPGNYTVQVSGVGATNGLVLIEVYEVQ